MNGPVVTTAKAALDKGDVTPVLKWVKRDDEAEIRRAFKETLAVRKNGPEAKDLADRFFFETLVRIHRAGEGAPFTGLKSVEPGEAVEAADKALETGSVDSLAKEVSESAGKGIRDRFQRALEKMKHADESVEAGREYVEAYIEYVHYVERLHGDILRSGGESTKEIMRAARFTPIEPIGGLMPKNATDILEAEHVFILKWWPRWWP
jgi:hypothetical protein